LTDATPLEAARRRTDEAYQRRADHMAGVLRDEVYGGKSPGEILAHVEPVDVPDRHDADQTEATQSAARKRLEELLRELE